MKVKISEKTRQKRKETAQNGKCKFRSSDIVSRFWLADHKITVNLSSNRFNAKNDEKPSRPIYRQGK